MLDTSSFSDKELSQVDPFNQEIEAFWHDMNVTPFIGVFVAKDEQEACEIAAKELLMFLARLENRKKNWKR